ncbi:tRNA 4-thiouridine(8) synthase ThiI [bacterium]|nr:tRNA 4-thiouridine(8) synthase ThiI [bacterium]
MSDNLIVRYGDLYLKGKNRNYFLMMANSLLEEKLHHLDVKIKAYGERVYIDTKNEKLEDVIEALNHVSGLFSYSLYTKCPLDLDKIKELALETYDKYHKNNESFKIEARRTYKQFELDSLEIMKVVSAHILRNRENCLVDVHSPDLTIYIEIREDGAYVLTSSIKGMGGYPTGTGGKTLLMMSGGIDSPVAAYELIKQGMTIEIVHFESTPLTSIESAQKVIDLAKCLCRYTRGAKVYLHMVPFKDVHNEILTKVREEYLITIMRRCMYRIAEGIARYRKIQSISNGESLGQVASQTVESMFVINNVTNYPVLRPLLTMDKKDIIKISKIIGTYDISIRPFEDCCTVYVPEHPATKPNLKIAKVEEEKGDFDNLINDAIKNTKRILLKEDSNIDLASLGFTVSEALDNYENN